jgi:hypothetical protein
MLSVPLLQSQLESWFGSEMRSLRNAIFVPLGGKVAQALESVARSAGISSDRILTGLPHPSGANAERIAFFLDRKDRAELSRKTEPNAILTARGELMAKLKALQTTQYRRAS